MSDYPKFEKATDNSIRIINESIQEVSLAKVLETKKQLEEKITQYTETLKNVNKIIENAEKLGIVAEEKKEGK